MKQTTLCLCIKGDLVLLGMKKRGFGAGKWNGYGGKVVPPETVLSCTVRETAEESGLILEAGSLEQRALVHFYFEEAYVFECSVFVCTDFEGDPVETDEMAPRWFLKSALPFSEMWIADIRFFPLILQGESVEVTVKFNGDGSEILDYHCKPTTFS